MEIVCPHCKNPVSDTFFFCPTCGKKLKDPPLSTGIGKQIGLYIFAILLPPFGLIPAFKYLIKGKTSKAKIIGLVTLLLTLIVSVATILLTVQVVSQAYKVTSSQLQLQDLNYQQ